MISKIVVPLDGSPFAEHAIPAAVAVARRANATMELVGICRPPFSSPYVRGVRVYDEAVVREGAARHRQYLDAQAAAIRQTHGLTCDTAVHVGPVLETLVTHLVATTADMVVMTTHGGDSPNRSWLGSITDRMIRQSPVPLLLIRPATARGALGRHDVIRTIVAAVDGSRMSTAVARTAGDIAGCFDAEVVLFCAVPVGPHPFRAPLSILSPDEREMLEHETDAMRRALDELALDLRARGVRVSVRVEHHDHASTAIEETVVGLQAELVVMATHGRGAVARFFLGSVADKVVRSGSTAVLLVGPEAA